MSDKHEALLESVIDKTRDFVYKGKYSNSVDHAEDVITLCQIAVLDEIQDKTLRLKARRHDRRVFLQIIESLRQEGSTMPDEVGL